VVGLDAAAAGQLAEQMLANGERLTAIWRHVVLQLLDDYEGDRHRNGTSAAAGRFTLEPAPTSSPQVDAALAALAEHLSRRDGWTTPPWATDSSRYSRRWWFVAPLQGIHATALQQSPSAFRRRGVFITADGLARV
jgi:hypothetical protein